MLNFFLHHIFSILMFPMFAAAAPALGSVGESAGSDPGLGGGASEEPAAPDSASPLPGGSEEGADTLLPESTAPVVQETDTPQDGRQLTGAIRKVLSDLKTTNPAAHKELRAIVFQNKDFQTLFPGGINEAKELRTKLEEIGGFEQVEEAQTELADYRQLDQAFLNGDPQFVETAVKQYPDGFKKLMPRMMNTWAEVDREGYNREFAPILVSSIEQMQLPMHLSMMKFVLSRSQDQQTAKEALDMIGQMEQWYTNLKQVATRAPQKQSLDPERQQLQQQQTQLAEREKQGFIQGVGQKAAAYQKTEISKAVTQLAGTKPVSAEALGIIDRNVRQEIMERLGSDQAFVAKYDRLIQAKDSAGAVRLLNSRAQGLIPEVAKKMYRGLYGQATLGAQKPAVAAPKAAAVPQGWSKVAGPPGAEEIDRSKTNRGMLFSSQAVLKNGKSVYWGDKAPT